jgi:hypothetical protein
MKRTYIPLLIFLVLVLLAVAFSFNSTPGWHTTIFPKYIIWVIFSILVLLFVSICYWLLTK